jgi:hypothetical protein
MKQQSPKLTRLNQQPPVAHGFFSIILRVYQWLARERVIVVYGRGDTDES